MAPPPQMFNSVWHLKAAAIKSPKDDGAVNSASVCGTIYLRDRFYNRYYYFAIYVEIAILNTHKY